MIGHTTQSPHSFLFLIYGTPPSLTITISDSNQTWRLLCHVICTMEAHLNRLVSLLGGFGAAVFPHNKQTKKLAPLMKIQVATARVLMQLYIF